MLAENLVDIPFTLKPAHVDSANEQPHDASGEMNGRCHLGRTKQPGSGRELYFCYHILVFNLLENLTSFIQNPSQILWRLMAIMGFILKMNQ